MRLWINNGNVNFVQRCTDKVQEIRICTTQDVCQYSFFYFFTRTLDKPFHLFVFVGKAMSNFLRGILPTELGVF